jgi:hypothetical protein
LSIYHLPKSIRIFGMTVTRCEKSAILPSIDWWSTAAWGRWPQPTCDKGGVTPPNVRSALGYLVTVMSSLPCFVPRFTCVALVLLNSPPRFYLLVLFRRSLFFRSVFRFFANGALQTNKVLVRTGLIYP